MGIVADPTISLEMEFVGMKSLSVLAGFVFLTLTAVIASSIDVDPWKNSDLSLHVLPQFVMRPSSTTVTYAPSVDVVVNYLLPFLRILSIRGDIAYTALKKESTTLNLIDVGPGVGAFLSLGRFGFNLFASTGIAFGIISDSSQSGTSNTSNPYVAVGTNVSYRFSDSLNMPMDARLIEAHHLVEESRGQVSVMRGPVVYCLESPDIPDGRKLEDLSIPRDISFTPQTGKIDSTDIVYLQGEFVARDTEEWGNQLYRELGPDKLESVTARMIPYFCWDNRGLTDMSVWIPLA